MEWMGLNDIREKFLQFFESKGHYRLPSFSLVPRGDKSLLLINSGMAPLKPYFKGTEVPPSKRVTTCQKCIRTPDIDQVGHTARHGTFFEMLGNFSFGDYFKEEAISWAWEFSTQVMKLPPDKLYASVYLDDDEAVEIWTKKIGLPMDHIKRLGKEDNFWEHGAGPCGPCSELYFDRGEKYGCGKPDCGVGCECDRYVEFWNLVFTQFDSDGKGNYPPLDHPNIDTGMGLERLACILQGVDNIFEVDTIRNIMLEVSRITGVKYGDDPVTDISLRIITDHIRSTVFMVSDGILPSNEGRGYVLRRLLRRAARHGRILGTDRAFLSQLCDTVIDENKSGYPELAAKRDYIKKVVEVEENRFEQTINLGLSILESMVDKQQNEGTRSLPGADAFKLYDTFGFPLELVKEILAERGFSVDEDSFLKLMERQKVMAREARLKLGDKGWASRTIEGLDITKQTAFLGYETLESDAELCYIVSEDRVLDGAQAGDQAAFILDRTPFYAESGGQIGDRGVITKEGAEMQVKTCVKLPTGQYLHTGNVTQGSFLPGDRVTAQVDADTRRAIMRNHSCVHLIQAALRKVLGTHVEQAGSYVDAEKLRFDFSHFSAMTSEELEQVETLVNREILEALPVTVINTTLDEAKKMGAMALFGEKYGDEVRVVKMGDFSTELCGGTHVSNTANIGLCRILTESSAAAGVRRIEATTGLNIIKLIHLSQNMMEQVADTLKTNAPAVIQRVEQLMNENRELQQKLDALNSQMAASRVGDLISKAKSVNGVRVLTAAFENMNADELRKIGDELKEKFQDVVAVLSVKNGDKLNFLAVSGKDAIGKGFKAGDIVKKIAQIAGGNGGGRPDSAMAGGKDAAKQQEALDSLYKIVDKDEQ